MPISELDVELKKHADAKKEFDDAVADIMDKTDEEIKEIEEARLKEADGTGESTGDQSTDTATTLETTEDPQKKTDIAPDPTQSESVKPSDTTALQAEVESLKAELQKERQRTSSWDGRIKAANDKVKLLEAENAKLTEQLSTKAATEENEQDETDQEVMDKFRKTFPELVEVVNILEKKIKVTEPAEAKSDAEPEVKPDTTTEDSAADAETGGASTNTEHYDTTRKAHPDLDEAVNSGVLLTWINKQPDYIRPHLENVYYGANGNGSAKQVIEMVTEFKNKSGWKSAVNVDDTTKQDKLKGMLEAEGNSAGAKTDGPDKNDFAGAAKEAFK